MFYFIYINLQESIAFLVAAFFSDVKTATGLVSALEVAINVERIADMKENVYEKDEPNFSIYFQQLI